MGKENLYVFITVIFLVCGLKYIDVHCFESILIAIVRLLHLCTAPIHVGEKCEDLCQTFIASIK